MSQTKAERLRHARTKAGFTSAAEAAQRFGWQEPAYRHHENGTRSFGLDAAKKYGRAFRVKPGWLLGLENVREAQEPYLAPDQDRLIVNGSVAAGVWRETEHWDDDRLFAIEGSQSPAPGVRRFGVVVEGRSMDLAYEPGTVLDCLSIFDTGVKPQSGDHVIVQRIRPDGLTEMTVKEYLEENGHHFLVPRSTRREFQERIEIGAPDGDHIGEDRVEVIAFVVGAYPPRAVELLKRIQLVR